MISYLKTQIAEIKPQAKASRRTALEYGYTNGLGLLDGLPIAGSVSGAGISKAGSGAQVSGRAGGVENARTTAQQKVKALEVQIQEATKAGAGSLYFASKLASLTISHQLSTSSPW